MERKRGRERERNKKKRKKKEKKLTERPYLRQWVILDDKCLLVILLATFCICTNSIQFMQVVLYVFVVHRCTFSSSYLTRAKVCVSCI